MSRSAPGTWLASPAVATAAAVEWLKLRRSAVARIVTPLLVLLPPAGAVGAVALARSPGLAGAAAPRFAPYATGDLAAVQLLVLAQILSVAALGAGGFALAWVFGRELTDGTAGALFGLAVPRGTIATAKLVVVGAWLAACVLAAVTVGVGLSVAAGGRPGPEAWAHAGTALGAGLLATGLSFPFAAVATATRSPLGTVGALIGVVALTQVVVLLGAGAWFPYAIPSLWTELGGAAAAAEIGPGRLLLTAAVAPLAAAVVVTQWRHLTDV